VSQNVDEFFAQSRHGEKPWSDAKIYSTRIRRNIRLAEAPSFGQSIFQYAPTSNGAADYQDLCLELLDAGSRSPETQGEATAGYLL
jgi:chromosome partitioning protein